MYLSLSVEGKNLTLNWIECILVLANYCSPLLMITLKINQQIYLQIFFSSVCFWLQKQFEKDSAGRLFFSTQNKKNAKIMQLISERLLKRKSKNLQNGLFCIILRRKIVLEQKDTDCL